MSLFLLLENLYWGLDIAAEFLLSLWLRECYCVVDVGRELTEVLYGYFTLGGYSMANFEYKAINHAISLELFDAVCQ